MADWITKLDDFLKLSDREILTHAGSISHDDAVEKAAIEFERYSQTQRALPSQAEKDFDDAIRDVKQIEQKRKKATKKPRSE